MPKRNYCHACSEDNSVSTSSSREKEELKSLFCNYIDRISGRGKSSKTRKTYDELSQYLRALPLSSHEKVTKIKKRVKKKQKWLQHFDSSTDEESVLKETTLKSFFKNRLSKLCQTYKELRDCVSSFSDSSDSVPCNVQRKSLHCEKGKNVLKSLGPKKILKDEPLNKERLKVLKRRRSGRSQNMSSKCCVSDDSSSEESPIKKRKIVSKMSKDSLLSSSNSTSSLSSRPSPTICSTSKSNKISKELVLKNASLVSNFTDILEHPLGGNLALGKSSKLDRKKKFKKKTSKKKVLRHSVSSSVLSDVVADAGVSEEKIPGGDVGEENGLGVKGLVGRSSPEGSLCLEEKGGIHESDVDLQKAEIKSPALDGHHGSTKNKNLKCESETGESKKTDYASPRPGLEMKSFRISVDEEEKSGKILSEKSENKRTPERKYKNRSKSGKVKSWRSRSRPRSKVSRSSRSKSRSVSRGEHKKLAKNQLEVYSPRSISSQGTSAYKERVGRYYSRSPRLQGKKCSKPVMKRVRNFLSLSSSVEEVFSNSEDLDVRRNRSESRGRSFSSEVSSRKVGRDRKRLHSRWSSSSAVSDSSADSGSWLVNLEKQKPHCKRQGSPENDADEKCEFKKKSCPNIRERLRQCQTVESSSDERTSKRLPNRIGQGIGRLKATFDLEEAFNSAENSLHLGKELKEDSQSLRDKGGKNGNLVALKALDVKTRKGLKNSAASNADAKEQALILRKGMKTGDSSSDCGGLKARIVSPSFVDKNDRIPQVSSNNYKAGSLVDRIPLKISFKPRAFVKNINKLAEASMKMASMKFNMLYSKDARKGDGDRPDCSKWESPSATVDDDECAAISPENAINSAAFSPEGPGSKGGSSSENEKGEGVVEEKRIVLSRNVIKLNSERNSVVRRSDGSGWSRGSSRSVSSRSRGRYSRSTSRKSRSYDGRSNSRRSYGSYSYRSYRRSNRWRSCSYSRSQRRSRYRSHSRNYRSQDRRSYRSRRDSSYSCYESSLSRRDRRSRWRSRRGRYSRSRSRDTSRRSRGRSSEVRSSGRYSSRRSSYSRSRSRRSVASSWRTTSGRRCSGGGRDWSAGHKSCDSRRFTSRDSNSSSEQSSRYDDSVTNTGGHGGDRHLAYKIGDVLNSRYEILSTLGTGTFSKVISCNDRQNNRRVALKIIKDVPKYKEAAELEISVLRDLALKDPKDDNFCIRMHSTFEHLNHVCLVFDSMGLSLYEFLKSNNYQPYTMNQIRHVGHQLLKALTFLHANGLTHTDLKPENILFVNSDYSAVESNDRAAPEKTYKMLKQTNIRLIDFGSTVTETEFHARVISTRQYRAVEVILELKWSRACDVWSSGCILFEMYTGHTLFQTHSNVEHLAMMEVILGLLPPKMIHQSRKKSCFSGGRLLWDSCSRDGRYVEKHCKPFKKYMLRGEVDHHDLFDLVLNMLTYDPEVRTTSRKALEDRFFDKLRNSPDGK